MWDSRLSAGLYVWWTVVCGGSRDEAAGATVPCAWLDGSPPRTRLQRPLIAPIVYGPPSSPVGALGTVADRPGSLASSRINERSGLSQPFATPERKEL